MRRTVIGSLIALRAVVVMPDRSQAKHVEDPRPIAKRGVAPPRSEASSARAIRPRHAAGAGPDRARRRPGAGRGPRPAARARRWRRAADRPALAPAAWRGPAPARGRDRRGRAGHPRGHGRAPRAAGTRALPQGFAAALPDPLLERDRLARAGVFSRPRGLADGDPAERRGAGGERHAAPLQGQLADRPSRAGGDARGVSRRGPGAAGLSLDGRAEPARARPADPCRPRRAAGAAGVAGRGFLERQQLAELRRCLALHPPAGRRGRDRARLRRRGAGSPSTSCSPTSWRWACCAGAPTAAGGRSRPRESCGKGCSPPCPFA